MRLGSVLGLGRVGGVRLGQTVGGLGTDILAVDAVVVVKGALVGTGGIRVQQRAADFLFLVVAGLVGVLGQSVGWCEAEGVERGRTGA